MSPPVAMSLAVAVAVIVEPRNAHEQEADGKHDSDGEIVHLNPRNELLSHPLVHLDGFRGNRWHNIPPF